MMPLRRNRIASAAREMIGIAGCLALSCIYAGCTQIGRARMDDNESSAIEQVRELHIAQTQYFTRVGRYAASLKELEEAGIIDSALATGEKKGYRYQLAKAVNGYTITAAPNAFNGSGVRNFYSDQTKVIHQHHGRELATVQDPQVR